GDPRASGPAANPDATNQAAAAAGLTAVPGVTSAPGVTRAASPTAGAGATGSARADSTVVPSVPANLTATPVSATTIRLQWTDTSSNESGFTVINGSTSKNAGANATTLNWDGLAPDTRMCFKVRAHNAAGVSAYFPAAQQDWVCAVSLPGTGPAAPADLTATAVSATAIRLQWTDTSGNESGFTVINGSTSKNTGANATSYTWDGLTAGTYMCFKVRAYNTSGVSAYSPPGQQDWACATTPST
ncbi:fibronectin type III domain-containing protein, partial [Dactylosporangium sp. NPDC049525]|uniref:fibronectin type III domain-containing protein n=1 Tax=Dactylosporangium sp. NPDC049525 TaxID=3154730 RepID=UPI00343DC66A